MFPNHLGAQADPVRSRARLVSKLCAFHRLDFIFFDAQNASNGVIWRENFAHAASPKFRGAPSKKFFHGRAHEHCPALSIKEQQTIFEPAHHLIEILAQGAENFAHVAQLLSNADDFLAHLAEFIGAFHGLEIEFACRDAVQLSRDTIDRRERNASDEKSKKSGKKHGSERVVAGFFKAWRNFIA